MHRLSSHFVLAYHGCDDAVAQRLLAGEPFKSSEKDYDWLGPGIYFWEVNPQRGLDWAKELSKRPQSKIRIPAVVGAVIDLGLCLDMMTQGAIELVRDAYQSLSETIKLTGVPIPSNGPTLMLRRLDCAVVRRVHTLLEQSETRLDTVRGVFVEGKPVYPTAGFDEKTHIQICVCNPASIKAVFRVNPSLM